MIVRVVAFASASDLLGPGERAVELPAGASLEGLGERLRSEFPALARLWPVLAIAVDGVICPGDVALRDGCEVALLPPVSGG